MWWLLSLAAVTLLVAPLLLALAGWLRTRREQRATSPAPFPWRLCTASTLAFTLAFNLQFFLQEVFLVLPKALTPGLTPTLYHNNHDWTGEHPLAELFQGTGALATLIAGALCAAFVARVRGAGARLLLVWLAYCGVLMALAQVVVGALSPWSDVGRAMTWLQMPTALRYAAAVLALLLMPAFALWLLRRLPASGAAVVTGRTRAREVFATATLPLLLGLALIIPFRVPREFIEVVIVPAAVILAGLPWLQAGALLWPDPAAPPAEAPRLTGLVLAVPALLALFQLVLRPGLTF